MSVSTEARPKKVLVIDDSPDMRLLVRRFLEKEGYEIVEMESAMRLDQAIVEFSPDLVLSDVMMPGHDGLTVCRRLRSDPRTSSLPVILMSSKSFEQDKRAAIEAGASGYLVKPFNPMQLLRTVSDALATEVSVKIWGCRGSIPSPERALGLYGGNTSCVTLTLPGNRHVIFDAGSGIRGLGNDIVGQSPVQLALLLTHFHWDHIQGLPFFKPLYVPGNEIHIYGPAESSHSLSDTLAGQMGGAFFPVSIESFRSSLKFFSIQEQHLEVFGVEVSTLHTFHPGTTLGYRVKVNGRSFAYIPDNELLPEMTEPTLTGEAERLAEFLQGVSVVMHDCQYSRALYDMRRGWGHSCGKMLAHVIAETDVERVLLFHHEPDHPDEAVQAIHTEFVTTLAERGGKYESEPAAEGCVFTF